jgi:arginyl-tRNA synthetase
MNPRRLAETVAQSLRANDLFLSVGVAGPGFINLTLDRGAIGNAVSQICQEGANFGRSNFGKNIKVNVEYVSVNPNGPITVANARGGAIGSVLANLLEWAGFEVGREYYVNDALNSTQMQLFADSLAARYLELCGRPFTFPEEGYRGEYVTRLAREFHAEVGESLSDRPQFEIAQHLQRDIVSRMIRLQKADLERFNCRFDTWYSEQNLFDEGLVDKTLQELRDRSFTYEAEGAVWLKSSLFGDDKDRVLVRADGRPTYIASDIAYHQSKFARGFQHLINIWGADHHGYIARLKAGVQALGFEPGRVEILISQLVRLVEGGETAKMSKREGVVAELSELLDEVGVDAARFFYLMRSHDSPLDFDLDLAKRQGNENPVYYVQYAHARICSILRHAQEQGVKMQRVEDVNCRLLIHPAETRLILKLADLPYEIAEAARLRAPHAMTRFAQEVATEFHNFYQQCRVVTEDAALTHARLKLCTAAQVTLANTLSILGTSAPERM